MAAPGAVRFLVNPAAGRGTGRAHLDRIRVLASRHGAGLVVTRKVSDLWEQARRAAEDGVERLLVAGGDGTMHHVIQGLAGTPCALGVVPLGTGNDLAGTLGVPPELEPAVERALVGEVRSIDLVRVGETYCVSYAGVGFDSEVTRYANEGVKILKGPLVYFYAVIHTLITFEPPWMRVVHDGGTFEGRVMFTVVNNLPRFGGGMRIAPDAKIDDGLLDLVIVKEISKRTLLSVFPKVYSGKHVGHPDVLMLRTRRAEITIDRAMTMYGGGEPLRPVAAGEPVAMEVVPGGLRVVGSTNSN
ncbi:MAG TPA: diacylglycerol kinase family protein [Thermoanaerobaculia bacterium]|jgi:diacylglycerol kinase (ATP)|nr:diacylglycerol kinase family protein [Thermoanaerobaculia bacterium]